ncbi:hypothetical protein AAKU55_005930 [Oxalobacteraceae bacterium GrIS 1.11]
MQEINDAIKSGAKKSEDFIRRIREDLERKTEGWIIYAAPEVLGQIQRQIALVGFSDNSALRGEATELMAMALEAPQTMNHLETVAERMTATMGSKQDKGTGFAMINACVAGTPYADCLVNAQQRLSSAQVLKSQPFIWNSEPEFVVATLGIEHPMYS